MSQQKTMQQLRDGSFLSGENDGYLENLYETYLKAPENVSPEWRDYFNKISFEKNNVDVAHSEVRHYFAELAKQRIKPSASLTVTPGAPVRERNQEKIIDLISSYRNLGHLQANIDPLGLYRGINNPVLDLAYYGFTEADLNKTYDVGTLTALKKPTATLNEIYQALRKIYSSTIGVEYMHIMQQEEVKWIQQRMEHDWFNFQPTQAEKLHILDGLVAADGLEKYLGNKYVGQKRFSLEGGDALVPMLDTIIRRGTANGIKDIVIGMAHRGRLNVLVNLLGKAPSQLFAHFEGKGIDISSSGDVKYHLGFSSDIQTENGALHLSLAFNPSHLEIVSPVVQGSVRSRQRRRRDTDRKWVMPIQIHGDAAFAGQGVVMETFNMSQARWFWVGGSIHIVINNQIGFTISNPKDARSGVYCTDIAKMVQAPVIHVNANDPEAVFFAAKVAADYRTQFKKDIVIDLVCYRRHGHNEADEPMATQPVMYKIIKDMPPVYVLYAAELTKQGILPANQEKQLFEDYRNKLDAGNSLVPLATGSGSYEYSDAWGPFLKGEWTAKAKTAVPLSTLQSIGKQLEKLPPGFVLQPQVKKMMDARQKMTDGQLPLNWGYAEAMAFATLLTEGYPIRICGQDSGRGTFAHRHSILHDQNNDAIYIPLSYISKDQAQINIVDSLLSEEAVLAFEYGFASAEPNNLVIWEAQFGDFANGAQMVIDQFISSGEQKWGRLCGLVMLLPHGYEGQGPEHSSARLERYLQLCAQHNMQVCVPSTPAQIFHLLRRQMLRPYRAPLIVMTPKSFLRHPEAVSTLEDLAKGEYQLVIPETEKINADQVERVVLCAGKVYYDLIDRRREIKQNKVAIVRVEQLYPYPEEVLSQVLGPYKKVKDIVWCQEEPINQGAWYATQHHIRSCLNPQQTLQYVGRSASASPAVGYAFVHLKEQAALVNQALKTD